MKCVAIIPARLESSRFPGKVLCDLAGKPMLQWVFERVKQARCLAQVYIATDAPKVEAVCSRFTANIIRTSPNHLCGSDRVAEAARTLEADLIVNVQGDEPLIDPELIDRLAALFDDPTVTLASAMTPIRSAEDLFDRNVVKVVTDAQDNALYFSRAAIPWSRDDPPGATGPLPASLMAYQHIGLYCFRRETLFAFAALPPDPLELLEGLEPLRALAHRWPIKMLRTDRPCIGVDTEKDLEKVRTILEQQ